jgi:hypothetical protein
MRLCIARLQYHTVRRVGIGAASTPYTLGRDVIALLPCLRLQLARFGGDLDLSLARVNFPSQLAALLVHLQTRVLSSSVFRFDGTSSPSGRFGCISGPRRVGAEGRVR